eukprot:340257_1
MSSHSSLLFVLIAFAAVQHGAVLADSRRTVSERVDKFETVSISVLLDNLDQGERFPELLRLQFESNDQVYTLELTRQNNLMRGDYESMMMNRNNEKRPMKSHPRNCFYKGFVSEDRDGSMVSLSICNGADGMVVAFGDSFVLEPLDRSAGSVSDKLARAHAFYRMDDDSDFANAQCGQGHQPSLLRGRRRRNNSGVKFESTLRDINSGNVKLQQTDDNILDILIVNDFSRISLFNGDFNAVEENTISIINGMNALYANMFVEPLRIRLVQQIFFDEGNPFGPTGIADNVDSSQLLNDFRTWRSNVRSGLPDHDASHAFFGFDFAGSTIGVAFVNTVCSRGGVSAVGVDQITFGAAISAVLVAHELGHNFGFRHDGDTGGNSCGGGFIMAPSLTRSASGFSTCSRDVMDTFLRSTNSACLLDTPPTTTPAPTTTTTRAATTTRTTQAQTTTRTTQAQTTTRATTRTTTIPAATTTTQGQTTTRATTTTTQSNTTPVATRPPNSGITESGAQGGNVVSKYGVAAILTSILFLV